MLQTRNSTDDFDAYLVTMDGNEATDVGSASVDDYEQVLTLSLDRLTDYNRSRNGHS
jgi:hypothetical protein